MLSFLAFNPCQLCLYLNPSVEEQADSPVLCAVCAPADAAAGERKVQQLPLGTCLTWVHVLAARHS